MMPLSKDQADREMLPTPGAILVSDPTPVEARTPIKKQSSTMRIKPKDKPYD